tara:strand:+ start:2266 stop:2385 length:120 start_codon:yes stop_codon:yes gene_type:complete
MKKNTNTGITKDAMIDAREEYLKIKKIENQHIINTNPKI